MRRVVGTLAVVAGLMGATPASASVVVHTGATLELTSSGSALDETVTLVPSGGKVRVESPQDVSGDCVECDASTVSVKLGGGHDSVDASALAVPVIVSLDDGGDTVRTGSGDDAIAVVGTDDVVWAGEGGDVITGAGDLHGEGGNDLINGGGLLDGGPGDDHLIGVIGTLTGGPGRDTAEFSLSGAVHVSLDGVANDGVGNLRVSNVMPDVEVLRGGASADVFDIRDGNAGAVACGGGDDSVDADADDVVDADCEHVSRPVVETPTPTPSPTPTETATAEPPVPVLPAAVAQALVVPDHTPPVTAVKLGKTTSRAVTARVSCSEACTVKVVLKVGKRVLGRAKAKLTRVGTVKLTVKHARLRKARQRATLVTTVTDVDGNARSVSRALTLRR